MEGRRAAISDQVIALSDLATRVSFTGEAGLCMMGTADPSLRYRRTLRVRRWWHPISIPESIVMIEWVLLMESLGFGPLPEGGLSQLLGHDIENWNKPNG